MDGALKPADFRESTQRFLFACAYWVAAADEELVPAEQEWLENQFGKETVERLLGEFMGMSREAYFELFDTEGGLIPFEEYERVTAGLNGWLLDLMVCDGEAIDSELESTRKIFDRFGIKQDFGLKD